MGELNSIGFVEDWNEKTKYLTVSSKKDIEISSLREKQLVQAQQLRYERRVLAYMGVMVTIVVLVILYNRWLMRTGRRKTA